MGGRSASPQHRSGRGAPVREERRLFMNMSSERQSRATDPFARSAVLAATGFRSKPPCEPTTPTPRFLENPRPSLLRQTGRQTILRGRLQPTKAAFYPAAIAVFFPFPWMQRENSSDSARSLPSDPARRGVFEELIEIPKMEGKFIPS